MVNLFDGVDLVNFKQDKERYLKEKISSYNDSKISSMASNIDDEIETLISSCNLNVPILKKEQTKTSIMNRPRFSRFHQREVQHEVVVYTIPFEGNQNIFKYTPRDYNGTPIEVTNLDSKSLSIELTDTYGKITGNDEVIEQLQSSFLKKIKIIESVLDNLRENLDGYLHGLRKSLKDYINELEEKIKEEEALQNQRNISESKLNPFK